MSAEKLHELKTLASVCPELNMANYTEDDVRHLNDWAIEMSLLVERYALSQQPDNAACKSVQKRLAAQQPTQATQATPSIPSDGPSTYAQRFTAAVAVICGVTPPVALVCDWINKEERHDDLQQWVGSYAPGWVQNIAVLDAAHQMADQPTEGGNHEPAQQPATAIACGIPGMAKTTCPYCEQGFAFEHEQPATGEPFGYIHHFAAHDERGALIDTTWEADGCADPLPHPTFPAMWKWAHCTPFYTTPQPAQATQAEVTDGIRPEDFTVDVVVKSMGGFAQINTQGVRVTHKPTGISVTCDAARSQHANRNQAFEKLSAILALRPERVPMTGEQRNDLICTVTTLGAKLSRQALVGMAIDWTEAHHVITTQAEKGAP